MTPTQTYFCIARNFHTRLGLVFVQNAVMRSRIDQLKNQIEETKCEIAKLRGTRRA